MVRITKGGISAPDEVVSMFLTEPLVIILHPAVLVAVTKLLR